MKHLLPQVLGKAKSVKLLEKQVGKSVEESWQGVLQH